MRGPDDARGNPRQSPGQTLLSHESSVSAEKLLYLTKSKENDIGHNLSHNTATPSSGFHFSMHKWPGRGVPLLMPLRGGKHPTFRGSSNVYNMQNAGFPNDSLLANRGYTKPHSNNDLSEGIKKEISTSKQELNEHVVTRRSLLHDESEGQGDLEAYREAEGKENMERMTGLSSLNVGVTSKKKPKGKKINSNKRSEVNKSAVGSSKSSGVTFGTIQVKGKIKEFFKISNQESLPKLKTNAFTSNLRSKWKIPGRNKNGNEINDSISDVDTKMPSADVKLVPDASDTTGMGSKSPTDNVKKMTYASLMVEEHIVRTNKQKFAQNQTNKKVADGCFVPMDASTPFESVPYGSKVTFENTDELFLDDFQVEELSPDENKHIETEKESEAIRAWDSKIHLWSNGKIGNIRSLLSTLHLVLWPESGWKPVALVDIIEPNAVKKVYNKALLCLHPDKLQQKGADLHQKYIAEKVFDIIQEAWDYFSSLGNFI